MTMHFDASAPTPAATPAAATSAPPAGTLARLAAIAAVVALAGCGGGGSAPSAPPAAPPVPGAYADAVRYSSGVSANLASAAESAAVTHHQLALGGQSMAYTASAGHLTASDAGGMPEASMFYVGYVADGQDAGARPVTFVLSGGPGDSSAGLHLGAFAPRRLVTNDPSLAMPLPAQIVDNTESLLDTTDLVYIDEVGVGLSEAIAPNTNATFYGVDADAAIFRDAILRYLAANQRTASPVVLFGHSYGSTRAGVVARLLQAAGVRVAGIVLESPTLNYTVNCDVHAMLPAAGSCDGSLPTFAAVGAWYGLAAPAPSDLAGFLVQARSVDVATFAPAADAWVDAATPLSPVLADELQALTGMPSADWQSKPDMNDTDFRTALRPGMLIGRYDARMAVAQDDPLAAGGDPSANVLGAPFALAITGFLRDELGYTSTSAYVAGVGFVAPQWPTSHGGAVVPDIVLDLSDAMAQDAGLQVLGLAGEYDLCAPFFQTETDIGRLGAGANVQVKDYAAGHMIYLDDAARPQMKADLVAFYARVAASR